MATAAAAAAAASYHMLCVMDPGALLPAVQRSVRPSSAYRKLVSYVVIPFGERERPMRRRQIRR